MKIYTVTNNYSKPNQYFLFLPSLTGLASPGVIPRPPLGKGGQVLVGFRLVLMASRTLTKPYAVIPGIKRPFVVHIRV